MNSLLLVLLFIIVAVGFAAIFFTSVGTLIILGGAALYALLTGFQVVSLRDLVILGLIYGVGEVIEFVFVIIGTKMTGASNKSVTGGVVGGILGAIFGSPLLGVGILLGSLVGIFLGSFGAEYIQHKGFRKSVQAGAGGVLGRVGAIAAKLVIGFIMVWYIIAQVRGI